MPTGSRPPQVARPIAALDATEPFVPAEVSLGDVATYFTRLGFTTFGGPAAHIAMMQQDLVEQRRWMSQQRFLDTLGATQLVPGPNSTELAIHMGYAKRGIPGLIVAGTCFILPAFFITVVIAYFYVALGALPQTAALFYGIQPVIVAIILLAAYKLGLTACRTLPMIALTVLGVLVTLLTRIDTVWVILGGGGLGVLLALAQRGGGVAAALLLPAELVGAGTPLLAMLPQGTQEIVVAPLWELGLFFLKVGATLMGSGYVLISYMQAGLVPQGWLTEQQVLDAIAVGQMTPGPVFTTAAFVGYVNQAGPDHNVAAGLLGATVGAVGIFFPSFIIVLLLAPWIERIREWFVAGAFWDGVNAVVVGSIVATALQLLRTTSVNSQLAVLPVGIAGWQVDLFGLALFGIAAAILLLRPKLNSVILIVAGAMIGLAVGANTGF